MTSLLSKSKNRLILLVLLVLLLAVRVYHSSAWLGFDYDQEINAKIAREIVVNHKLTLIGPETSVGGMYVGPLYNYVIALFYMLGHMNPESVVPLNLLTSLATGIFCYLLAEKIFGNEKAGLLATFIYGLSQTLIEFDRVSWNPTPMILVTLGLVYFLVRYLSERQNWQLILAVVFVGFSIQLHFSAIFLLVFLFLSLILFGGKQFWTNWPALLTLLIILSMFFLPLALFDFRHSFLNSRHLLQFIAGSSHNQAASVTDFFRAPLIFVQFERAIFMKQPSQLADIAAAVSLTLTALSSSLAFLKKKPTIPTKLIGLFLTIYILGLGFYHGPLPSYFFLPILGLFIILSAGFLGLVQNKGIIARAIIALALLAFVLINLPPVLATDNGLSLLHKRQAVDFIVSDAGGKTFRVEFITALGLRTGYDYLFWLDRKEYIEDIKTPAEKVYKIVVPYTLVSPTEITATFGGVGVIRPNTLTRQGR